jgi:hypothetical protein
MFVLGHCTKVLCALENKHPRAATTIEKKKSNNSSKRDLFAGHKKHHFHFNQSLFTFFQAKGCSVGHIQLIRRLFFLSSLPSVCLSSFSLFLFLCSLSSVFFSVSLSVPPNHKLEQNNVFFRE